MATLIARYSTGGHCMWVLLVFGVWNEPRKLARAERVIYVYTRSIHYFIDFYFKVREFKLHIYLIIYYNVIYISFIFMISC